MLEPKLITVRRDGQADLRFRGIALTRFTGHTPDDAGWNELTLYRAMDGTFVLSKVWRAEGGNESDRYEAAIFTKEEAIEIVRESGCAEAAEGMSVFI